MKHLCHPLPRSILHHRTNNYFLPRIWEHPSVPLSQGDFPRKKKSKYVESHGFKIYLNIICDHNQSDEFICRVGTRTHFPSRGGFPPKALRRLFRGPPVTTLRSDHSPPRGPTVPQHSQHIRTPQWVGRWCVVDGRCQRVSEVPSQIFSPNHPLIEFHLLFFPDSQFPCLPPSSLFFLFPLSPQLN